MAEKKKTRKEKKEKKMGRRTVWPTQQEMNHGYRQDAILHGDSGGRAFVPVCVGASSHTAPHSMG